MGVSDQVLQVLDEVLSLGGRTATFSRDTRLLGAIPELDSMAVVTLITTLEERFGVFIDDDEIDGSTFSSVGTLVDFIGAKAATASREV
jgi:acyl carrier protein